MLLLISRCFQFFESITFYAWRFLTYLGYLALSFLCHAFTTLVAILNVMAIFAEELRISFYAIINMLDSSISSAHQLILTTYECTFEFAKDLLFAFRTLTVTSKTLESVTKDIANLLARSIGLIGECAMRLITFLPKAAVNCIYCFAEFCCFIIIKALEFVYYLMDSFTRIIGLLIVLCIIYKYSRIILPIIWRLKEIIVSKVLRILQRSLMWVLRLPTPSCPLTSIRRYPRSLSPTDDSKLLENLRCVVCQSRGKCVLLWPCRHLCLCEECTDVLVEEYVFLCPMCRSRVEVVMSVFM